MMKKKGKLIFAVAVLAACFAVYKWFFDVEEPVSFKTAEVVRTNVVQTIDATGTLEPEDLIDVGARVSGEIVLFGKDKSGKTIDFGSEVVEGEVIAVIDDTIPKSNLAQAEANLAQAEASVLQAKANLKYNEEQLKQAERNWARAQKLGVSEALSQSAYDSYLSDWETASAQIDISKAQIAQSEAGVLQAQAELEVQKRNLDYCIIKAPVNGVVIDRVVDIGQTVVSNMSASSLFLIAKDLSKMEVWASVNEADIGSITKGQKVTFTVDAFPSETFSGVVSNVRLNATMSQNVVTYIVEVSTDNSNKKLLPYLTANLEFEVKRADGVLAVPNGALRWRPTSESMVEGGNQAEIPSGRKVWVSAGKGKVRPISVETGISDGVLTEVKSPDLLEGMEVVTGVESLKSSSSNSVTNPFMPKPPARKKTGNSSKEK